MLNFEILAVIIVYLYSEYHDILILYLDQDTPTSKLLQTRIPLTLVFFFFLRKTNIGY